jgi:hypothetical protein
MPVSDTGFKIAARTSGRDLAELARLSCSRWQPVVSEVQVTERFADRAFRATYQGTRCVVYFEAYTTWKKDALWNVLAKAGMLSEREQLPTLSVVYVLRPRGYKDLNGEFQLQAGSQPTQKLWFFPVPLWQQVPANWWEDSPGLMALYPLTRHGRPAREAVRYAADCIQATVAETGLRADLLVSLASFGKLVYPGIDMVQLLGREQMRRSSLIEELFAEEFQEERRAVVLEALEERFGKAAAAAVAPRLEPITAKKTLRQLHRLAIRCSGLEEFQAALPN